MTTPDKPAPSLDREELRALYELLFTSAADAVLVVDDAGRIVLANPASEGLTGLARRELLGRLVEEVIPERFTNHVAKREGYLADARPRPMGGGLTLFARGGDGQEIPVDISLSPFMVAGRRYVGCSLRDLRSRSYGPESLWIQTTALRAAANGIVITDASGTIVWVNPAACRITGYAADELMGQHTRLLRSGEHDDAFYAALWQTVLRGETWSGTMVNRRKDGTLYSEEQTIAPVMDASSTVTHYIAIKQDVSDRLRTEAALVTAHAALEARVAEIEGLNRQLADQAVRDPLTGLYNRRYLDETIARDLARASRTGDPVTVAVLDLDRFKTINDTHGHAVGDQVLRRLAEVLRSCVRASDLVCRTGGEEFVVVLPGASLEVARDRADRWRRTFAAVVVTTADGADVSCTLSAGVARLFIARETFEGCLKRADAALYAAKHAGRDRVILAPDPPERPAP